jgi:tetratricopeptide (TPR) repeat protein
VSKKPFSAALAAIFLVCGTVAFATQVGDPPKENPREQVWKLYSLSHEYVFERNYEQAEKTLREALSIDPNQLMVMRQLAYVLTQRGRDEEAKALQAQFEAKYNSANPVEQFFVSMDGMKIPSDHPPPSEAQLKELEKKYPNDFLTYYTAGYFYQRNNNFPAAIRYFEKTLTLAPWMAQAHNQLGYLYTYVCRYDKAIQHLEAYARLLPERANPHDSLGETYFLTGRYEDAIREFKNAIAISPSFLDAHYHLIDAYCAVGQYENALNQATRLYEISDSPDYKVRVLLSLSTIYQNKGNLTAARDKAQAAIDLMPDWPSTLFQLGMVQIAQGDIPGVEQTIAKFQEQFLAPANGKKGEKYESLRIRYNVLVAKMNENMGNFQAAIQLLQRVSDQIPIIHRSVEIRRDLAEAYFAIGQPDRAREILEQILTVNPNHVGSLLLAAKIAASLSKDREAREYLTRCQEVLKLADKRTPVARDVQQLQQQIK